jgi:hypothetical protein
MAAMGAEQDDSSLQSTSLWPSRERERSGVLIVGARRGDVFVATEVLISAETLDDEDAIRAWLAQHDIHVAPPMPQHCPRPQGLRAGTAASGTPGRTWTADDQRTG